LTGSEVTLEQSEVEARVLASAVEDYTGLYEVIWELNTVFPEISKEVKVTAARKAVVSLLKGGLIELYHTVWVGGGYRLIVDGQAEVLANDPESYEPPRQEEPGEYYCFGATSKGEATYHGKNSE
jgi:predicted DNA-binding transcriptional regulator